MLKIKHMLFGNLKTMLKLPVEITKYIAKRMLKQTTLSPLDMLIFYL